MDKRTMNELTDYARSRIEGMEIGGEREALLKGLVSSMEIKYELDVPHWIPVTKRLPEKLGWYLISGEEDTWMGWYSTEGHGWRGVSGLPIGPVTAWMPLPEPYTEVKSNDNDQ